jgi:mono/diheme cytochrome c family protein
MNRTRAGIVAAILFHSVTAAYAQDLRVPQPSPGLIPNTAMGKQLFEKNCASCHGKDLNGTTKGPPFLNLIYRPAHHSDLLFQTATAYGARAHHWPFGDMQPVPGVTPDDVVHITAYVRMMQRLAGIE